MLLIQRKRFQFSKSYLYGSAAFVSGFGGVMAALIHFTPIRVLNARVANMSEAIKAQKAATETTVSQPGEADNAATNTSNGAASSTWTPVKNNNTTPDPDPLPIQLPIIEIPIDLNVSL